MQINLKQSEIELALKNFIAQQGIDLYGKDITISFTAGRKEAGLSAELVIEDAELPEFDFPEEASRPIPTILLRLAPVELLTRDAEKSDDSIGIDPQANQAAESPAVPEEPVSAEPAEVQVEEAQPEVQVEAAQPKPAATTTSLFS